MLSYFQFAIGLLLAVLTVPAAFTGKLQWSEFVLVEVIAFGIMFWALQNISSKEVD